MNDPDRAEVIHQIASILKRMKIHGVRIYPQSITKAPGVGAPIFVHERLSKERSDLDYVFRPIADRWRGHFFVQDFTVTYEVDGPINPIPGFRKKYGSDFYDADLKTQLLVLRADGFSNWAPKFYSYEGAFLPIFTEAPSFDLLNRLYWNRSFVLNSESWPTGMRSILHNWDDMFCQLFSVDKEDIDSLVSSHLSDPKLKIFFVEFDVEYPNPSNKELTPAA